MGNEEIRIKYANKQEYLGSTKENIPEGKGKILVKKRSLFEGVFQNGNVDIIANDQGNRTTPSYVCFQEEERLIGDAAKNQTAKNPTNTVFDAKRLIGRKFNDPIVQKDIKLWPFKVESGPDDKPIIVVKFKGETKKFHA